MPPTRTSDHDQRHAGAFSIAYDNARTGTWVSVSGQFASGTPLEVEEEELDELSERPGAERVDFERGRVRPRTLLDLLVGQRLYRGARVDVGARLSVLNLGNRAYAFNFGNPFSGTHFGAGRTISGSVRIAVR